MDENMKKLIFMCLACIITGIAIVGCSKEDDDFVSTYSERQEKAFALFNGTWADIQFSNLSGGELGSLLPDPDLIVFGTHFDKEIEVTRDDYMNGQEHLYYAQGECTYRAFDIVDEVYEDIECYYFINSDADYMALYDKKTNQRYKGFDMDIQSETRIVLHDPNLTLPYIFVKQ
jgi:hypothetical protein